MKAILLDEAKKWLDENYTSEYARMAIYGAMLGMPTVDYQEKTENPLTCDGCMLKPGCLFGVRCTGFKRSYKSCYVPEL